MFTDTIIENYKTGEASYDLTCAMNGALGGLVAVTAGTSVYKPWAALIVGMIGGWCYLGFSKFLVKMRIDDAVDAVPVHFANGMWGVFAVVSITSLIYDRVGVLGQCLSHVAKS